MSDEHCVKKRRVRKSMSLVVPDEEPVAAVPVPELLRPWPMYPMGNLLDHKVREAIWLARKNGLEGVTLGLEMLEVAAPAFWLLNSGLVRKNLEHLARGESLE